MENANGCKCFCYLKWKKLQSRHNIYFACFDIFHSKIVSEFMFVGSQQPIKFTNQSTEVSIFMQNEPNIVPTDNSFEKYEQYFQNILGCIFEFLNIFPVEWSAFLLQIPNFVRQDRTYLEEPRMEFSNVFAMQNFHFGISPERFYKHPILTVVSNKYVFRTVKIDSKIQQQDYIMENIRMCFDDFASRDIL